LLFASDPLKFEPGTSQAYSNGGYIVLGLIIEKITGQTFYHYVQQHIFQASDMNNTDFPFSDMRHNNEATRYSKTGEPDGSFSVPENAEGEHIHVARPREFGRLGSIHRARFVPLHTGFVSVRCSGAP
jgi:CubicO group peptidase (beta-lactamase class C family)